MQPTLPAQSKKHTYLKMHFNKIAYRRSREAAVTAVARKIAVIVWHMLTHKVGYIPIDSSVYNNRMKQKKIKKITKDMAKFNITFKELSMHNDMVLSNVG